MLLCGIATQAPKMPRLRLLKGESCVSASASHRKGNSNLHHVDSVLCSMFNISYSLLMSQSDECRLTIRLLQGCRGKEQTTSEQWETPHKINSIWIMCSGFYCQCWTLLWKCSVIKQQQCLSFRPCPSVNGAQGGYDLNTESCAVNLLNLDFRWLLQSLLLQLPHTSQVPVGAEAV